MTMSAIPAWIQILQALLTPAIAVAVGLIGFLQWRTAHQKVMLDLFDRRVAVYEQVMGMQRTFMMKGDTLSGPEVDHIHAVRGKARFLFGEDVNTALKIWHDSLIDLTVSADVLRMDAGSREEHLPLIIRAMQRTRPFRESFPELFAPYMRMDQKQIRTPAQWFEDRNRIRLSYADEKQRGTL
jgi:hypothetical protein